jgi:hypothetical protein
VRGRAMQVEFVQGGLRLGEQAGDDVGLSQVQQPASKLRLEVRDIACDDVAVLVHVGRPLTNDYSRRGCILGSNFAQ